MFAVKSREPQLQGLLGKQNISTPKIVLAARRAKAMLTPVGRIAWRVARNPFTQAVALVGGLTALAATGKGNYGDLYLDGIKASVSVLFLAGFFSLNKIAARAGVIACVSGLSFIGVMVFGSTPIVQKLTANAQKKAITEILGGKPSASVSFKVKNDDVGGYTEGTVEVKQTCEGVDREGNKLKLLDLGGEDAAYVLKTKPDGSTEWTELPRRAVRASQFDAWSCRFK